MGKQHDITWSRIDALLTLADFLGEEMFDEGTKLVFDKFNKVSGEKWEDLGEQDKLEFLDLKRNPAYVPRAKKAGRIPFSKSSKPGQGG